MPLHPEFVPALKEIEKRRIRPIQEMDVDEVRMTMSLLLKRTGPTEKVERAADLRIQHEGHSIPIRIYVPEGAHNLPILLFFHGGGWSMGDLETCDGRCRTIANLARCVVVSVDYRLAPEHPFPAAVEDGFHVLEWIRNHAEKWGGDASCVAVGGESAGANLAAAMTLMARDKRVPPLHFQWLIYPVLDDNFETASYKKNGKGYFLEKEVMAYYWDLYAPKNERKNPYACPLKAKSFKDLPPAFLATAEFDPLLDEGKLYSEKLKKAHVPVHYTCYKGMIHGFLNWVEKVPIAKTVFFEMVDELRAGLAREEKQRKAL